MSIGILGGTFDPVHCGHLRLAVEMLERLGLTEVRLIPARHPQLRKPPVADATRRTELLVQATVDLPRLRVDERELHRDGPTYTIDTLISLREELPRVPLCLILGMDAFTKLEGWHRWTELMDYAHIAVAERPGSVRPLKGAVADLVDAHSCGEVAALKSSPAGRICILEIPMLDISATYIRTLVAQRRSVRWLVPDPIHDLVMNTGSYQHAQ